ncbi:hypothetical protein BLOT_010366 [Blomia tropicalis]|nr:hypothetical protein BLOT_010366 [Blomia tropicalis]
MNEDEKMIDSNGNDQKVKAYNVSKIQYNKLNWICIALNANCGIFHYISWFNTFLPFGFVVLKLYSLKVQVLGITREDLQLQH